MNKNKIILLTSIIVVAIVASIFYIYNINSNDKKTTVTENIVIDKKITISDRCSGCGKCMMIDPEHFKLNETRRKAEVISQNNLGSNSILAAISMCKDRAISLN